MTAAQTPENKNLSSNTPKHITQLHFVELEEWQNWDAIGSFVTQSTSAIGEVL